MYRALYRKWRPLTFADVVGQAPIVTALRNQIATQHVGHAYLFTGVRGTGKTTCAKIFAKAINCMNPDAGDPCGQCEACRGIENGSILDVVEMDAASNNGVDNIRDLRDETAYTPSACQYKVYIIDEVHMLSTAAFNALLKTLEEPPPHVVFILATTEIQKVPATILSRCQRYDFTRIQPSDLAARAQYVAQQEGLTLNADAADLIARLADGAARDTLSILDTCAGVSSEIDAELVRRMTGVTDRSYLFAISHCVLTVDSVGMLAEIAALRQKSVDLKRLTEELILHYRNLMLAALPNGASLLSGVSPEEEAQYLSACKDTPQAQCVQAIRALGTALEKMTRGGDARIELELALFSLHAPLPAAPVASISTAQQAAAPVTFTRTPVEQPAPFVRTPVTPVAPVPSAPNAPATPSTPAPPTPAIIAEKPAPAAAPVAAAKPVAPPTVAPPAVVVPTPVTAPPVTAPIESPAQAPMQPAPPAPVEDDAPPLFTDSDAPPLFTDSDAPPLPDEFDAPYPVYEPADEFATDATPDDYDAEALTIDPTAQEETLIDAVKKRRAHRSAASDTPPNGSADAAAPVDADSTAEIRPFVHLQALKTALAPRNVLLAKLLETTNNAYLRGNTLLIDADSTFFTVLRAKSLYQDTLKEVLEAVAGKAYNVAPYATADTNVKQHDVMELLDTMQTSGVEISIQE